MGKYVSTRPLRGPVPYIPVPPSGPHSRCKCAGGDRYYPACESHKADAQQEHTPDGER